MNQEQIIEAAFKAGFVEYEIDDGTTDAFDKRYAKFAYLVAAAEREACAKVCEDDLSAAGDWHFETHVGGYFANAIKQRGETK